MNIVFHAHNATVNDALQRRAEQAVRKLAGRLPRVVDATVRFVEDGPMRRVEIELHAAPNRRLVSAASGRLYALALADAVGGLEAQVDRQRAAKTRRRRAAVRGGGPAELLPGGAAQLPDDVLADISPDPMRDLADARTRRRGALEA